MGLNDHCFIYMVESNANLFQIARSFVLIKIMADGKL